MPKKKSFLSEEIPIWLLIVIIGIIIIPMHFGITKYYNAQLNEVADEFCQARSYEVGNQEYVEETLIMTSDNNTELIEMMEAIVIKKDKYATDWRYGFIYGLYIHNNGMSYCLGEGTRKHVFYPNTFIETEGYENYECYIRTFDKKFALIQEIEKTKTQQIPFTSGTFENGKFECYGGKEICEKDNYTPPNHCIGIRFEKSQQYCYKNQEWIRCD